MNNRLTKPLLRGRIKIQLNILSKAVTKTALNVVSFRESMVGANRQKHSMVIPSEPSAERLVASTSAAVQRVSKWLRDAALMLRD